MLEEEDGPLCVRLRAHMHAVPFQLRTCRVGRRFVISIQGTRQIIAGARPIASIHSFVLLLLGRKFWL